MSDSCDLMNYSPPGSSVHGISQARILEWVAISFSKGSSQPGDQTTSPVSLALQADSLLLRHREEIFNGFIIPHSMIVSNFHDHPAR